MYGLPAPAFHLFEGGAGVLVPALVVPEDVAIGVGHPGELRDGVGEDAELFFAGFDFASGEHLGGDVDGVDEDAIDFVVGVASGLVGEVEPGFDGGGAHAAEHLDAADGFAGAVDAIEQLGEGLSGEFGHGFEEGLAEELEGGLALDEGNVAIVDEGEAVLRTGEDGDGGGGAAEELAHAGAFVEGLEREGVLALAGLDFANHGGELGGDLLEEGAIGVVEAFAGVEAGEQEADGAGGGGVEQREGDAFDGRVAPGRDGLTGEVGAGDGEGAGLRGGDGSEEGPGGVGEVDRREWVGDVGAGEGGGEAVGMKR